MTQFFPKLNLVTLITKVLNKIEQKPIPRNNPRSNEMEN